MQRDNWWANGTHNSVIIPFFVYCILLLSLCQGLNSVPVFLLYSRSQILYICFDMFHPACSSAVSNTVLSPCQRHIRVPWSNLWPFQFCKHMTSRLSLAYILTQDFRSATAAVVMTLYDSIFVCIRSEVHCSKLRVMLRCDARPRGANAIWSIARQANFAAVEADFVPVSCHCPRSLTHRAPGQ